MRVAENKRVAIDGGGVASFHVGWGQQYDLCHRARKPKRLDGSVDHHIAAQGQCLGDHIAAEDLRRRECPDPGMQTRVVPPPIQFLFLFQSPALRAPSRSATCSSTFASPFYST